MTTTVRTRVQLTSRVDRATRHSFTAEGVCWKVARVTTHSRHDDMTTTTTPTTKGWRSDVSIILPGWSVTLVGSGQYPRYTSAVKDGRPWEAHATDKAAKRHMNTTGTRSTPKLSHHGSGATVERGRVICFQVQVWLLSSQCGCV